MLGQVADGLQLFDGLVIVIAGGKRLGLRQNLLTLGSQLLRLRNRGIQLTLLVLLVNLMALNHVGQGADDKGKHHNQTHTDQQGRQVHLLEDLGAALSSAAAGIVRVHRLLPLLLVKHGAEIEVKESGKNIGGFQLGKLGQLDGLAGLFLLFGSFLHILIVGFVVFTRISAGGILIVLGLPVIGFLARVLPGDFLLRLLRRRIVLAAVLFRLLPGLLGFLAHIQKIVQIAVQIEVILVGRIVSGG